MMPIQDHAPRPLADALLRVAAMLWIIAPIWYLLCEAIAASGFPEYSYSRNYISDLGVLGADFSNRPLHSYLHAVLAGGLIGQAAMFGLGAVMMHGASPPRRGGLAVLLLSLTHAFGAALVAMVPSLKTPMPISGTYHGVGAMAAFVGGNLAMIALATWDENLLARPYRLAIGTLGAIGLLCLAVLMATAALTMPWPYSGLWERGAVYSVLLGEFLVGIGILCRESSQDNTD